jgi:hypothetical protein
VYLYTVGGLVAETSFSVLAIAMLVQFGWRRLEFVVAMMSSWLFVGAVVMLDIVLALMRGPACGDISGLWMLAKVPTALLSCALLGIRGWMLWYASPS